MARTAQLKGPGDLVVDIEETRSSLFLRVAGDLDLNTAGTARAALEWTDPTRIAMLVLDLQKVTFLDATGLRTVVRAGAYCRANHIHLNVIKPRGLARRLFTLDEISADLELIDSLLPASD